jgi:hypothetical protein
MLYAQCVQNNDFTQYCGVEIHKDGATGATFADDCVPGWMPSHGSPQIKWINFDNILPPPHNQTDRPQWNAAYMWAGYSTDGQGHDGARGEGIIAAYQFKHFHTYTVAIKYKVELEIPTGFSDGEIRLVAMQNLRRPTKWKTGNLRPYGEREHAIATLQDRNTTNQWRQSQTFTFVADNDYNQFWLYPYATNNNQYNLFVDWVYVCHDDCNGTINYNQGVLPVGEPKSGYINIGSSFGGSGTVTVSPTAQTTMIAANEIDIKPEFSATVTTGEFWAKIESCGSPNSRLFNDDSRNENTILPTENHGLIDNSPEYDTGLVQRKPSANLLVETSPEDLNKKYISIYPNPASGKVNIDLNTRQSHQIKIEIINTMGLVVKNVATAANDANHISVDIANLTNGQYFVKITDDKGNVIVKKIQKL